MNRFEDAAATAAPRLGAAALRGRADRIAAGWPDHAILGAAAFAGIPGVQLWHWPVGQRTENGSKLHAKLAVADQRILLVSSANLTQSGVTKNIEAGLLVRGGTAPRRAAEHIAELKTQGVLERLRQDGY